VILKKIYVFDNSISYILIILCNLLYLSFVIYILGQEDWCLLFYTKTIANKFLEWSKVGVFKKVYDKLQEIRTLDNIKKSTILDLFINSTNNKNGSPLTNFGQNKKKITKISVISDKKKEYFAVEFFGGNAIDVKTVEKSINALPEKIRGNTINLTGDKGYTMKKI
jgi:hypothetical protein